MCSYGVSYGQNIAKNEQAEVTLLGANYVDKNVKLALNVKMRPGWHIYWRTAGDTGFPPILNLEGSENIDGAEFLWPAPKRLRQELTPGNFLESYVYENEVTLPLLLSATNPSNVVDIKLHLSYAICADICIPVQADLDIKLEPGYKSVENLQKFDNALQFVPKTNDTNGLKVVSVATGGDNASKQVIEVLALSLHDDFSDDATIFIEGGDAFAFNNPTARISGKEATFVVPVIYLTGKKDFFDVPLKFTLVNGAKAVEFSINSNDMAEASLPAEDVSYGFRFLLLMLAFGFMGGLVLNIMPCVLPVLSIKMFGILKNAGGKRIDVTKNLLVTALGIFISFLFFAILTIWLKAAGEVVGWGLHFQQPYFIIALVIVLTLFAANLWGLYEIRLPTFLGGIGSKHEGLFGHFISGIFATILATPCTAPFLGVAIGFAVTQGASEILAIFMSMALGFAFPYLLFSACPAIITKLPRSGSWMIKVKKIMAALLALSAVWLIWVLSNQLGTIAAMVLFLLCIVKVIKLWAANHYEYVARFKIPLLAFIIILSFTVPVRISNNVPISKVQQDMWEEFKPEHINQLVGNGKIVFVDVTADWCLTCKVNKLAVLDRADIKEKFQSMGVVAMKADWTKRDTNIAEYLRKYKRAGIPFNVVYGPNAPEGIMLSELLSKKEVFEALEKAAK